MFKLFLKVSDVNIMNGNYSLCCHHPYCLIISVQNSRLGQTRPMWDWWWDGKADD